MRTVLPGMLVMGCIAMAGCGTVRDDGFAEVQRTVGERTPARIQWYQGTDADQRAAAAIKGLLAHELDADRAVQIALLNNRSLQATYEDLGIAQADLVRAGLLHNPMLNADLGFAPGGGTFFQMSLVTDFLDLIYIPMRKRLAQTEFEAAQLRVAGAVIDLSGEVRATCYQLQAALQRLDLQRTIVEAAGTAYDLAQRLRAAGNITTLDLAQQRGMYETTKLDLADAELRCTELREQLNTLLGVWGRDTTWTIAARLPDLPAADGAPEGLERRAIERSLDLAITRAAITESAQRLGVARPFDIIGEADLGVSVDHEVGSPTTTGPALSVPLPLFNLGQPAVDQARARLRQSQDLYAAQAIEIRSRVRTAHDRVAAARARAVYIRQVILPLRHAITQDMQLHYNGMLASPFRLLEAKQDELSAGMDFVQALASYWLARTSLDQLLEGRLPQQEGMDAPRTTMAAMAAGAGDH
jgi:cobalt-zinc-cadmium efflux system outer membrane protein